VRGKVQQRDRPAALRHAHAGRQIFRRGIVEPDFSALDHVREQQRREDLCYRAELEDRVAVERAAVTGTAQANVSSTAAKTMPRFLECFVTSPSIASRG